MFISTTSCDKLMHKRPDLVRVMEALSCGNQLVTQRETGRYSSGFNLECYGVLCGVNTKRMGINARIHWIFHPQGELPLRYRPASFQVES